jgi:hypothetical protein
MLCPLRRIRDTSGTHAAADRSASSASLPLVGVARATLYWMKRAPSTIARGMSSKRRSNRKRKRRARECGATGRLGGGVPCGSLGTTVRPRRGCPRAAGSGHSEPRRPYGSQYRGTSIEPAGRVVSRPSPRVGIIDPCGRNAASLLGNSDEPQQSMRTGESDPFTPGMFCVSLVRLDTMVRWVAALTGEVIGSVSPASPMHGDSRQSTQARRPPRTSTVRGARRRGARLRMPRG